MGKLDDAAARAATSMWISFGRSVRDLAGAIGEGRRVFWKEGKSAMAKGRGFFGIWKEMGQGVAEVLYADGGLPAVLKRFLTEEDRIFTGAHIKNDVKRLRDNFGITISNPIDLQLVVPEAAPRYEYLGGPHPLYRVRRSSLEKIKKVVLCLPHLRKPEGADHDN
ncbi:hypothetical protein C2845_PM09G12300 [Panicum miliaceum]|uniref:Uncharacterized protein n=1 Tax=Panicum miliaceum TaxID=4540 RepID=A0A3L6S0Z0_PANMI|nr:hypothetical protein C2845_PM09G12300 [Panicum miliaceum]